MIKKYKKLFVCEKCDSQFLKWQGRCPECGSWGTIAEQAVIAGKENKIDHPGAKTISFREITGDKNIRFTTGMDEFDRVLGGGLTAASLTLLGGDPGIGKSTLILQVASFLSRKTSVYYISGEESPEQVKQRVERLNLKADDLNFIVETNVDMVAATLAEKKPQVAIIDSIQTLYSDEVSSEAGSVQQVKVAAVKLLELAKKNNIAVIVIGHVTKEGGVAGPRTLEHLVDTVLYLEGDRYQSFRILRPVKNRFGGTGEIGVFEMKENGLEQVKNPSESLLKDRAKKIPGSVVTSLLDGNRPLLIEVQALVTRAGFGYPQRKSSGFDAKRLQMLIAVLIKRTGLRLFDQDIHVNVVGGISIKEPAADLAVCLAIVSALKNAPINSDLLAIGEVGLGGEIRPVIQAEKRLNEAVKLGFRKIIMPQADWKNDKAKIIKVKSLTEAIEAAFRQ